MIPDRIERELADYPAPPPPADLADRIKAEIPAELPVGTVVNFRPTAPRRQWRLAAAAVVTLALTGAVTWEMRNRRMSEDLLGPARPEVHATPAVPVSETEPRVVVQAGQVKVNAAGRPTANEPTDREQQPASHEGDEQPRITATAGNAKSAATDQRNTLDTSRDHTTVAKERKYEEATDNSSVEGGVEDGMPSAPQLAAQAPPASPDPTFDANLRVRNWREEPATGKLSEKAKKDAGSVADGPAPSSPPPSTSGTAGNGAAGRDATASIMSKDVFCRIQAPITQAGDYEKGKRNFNAANSPVPSTLPPSTGGTAEPNDQPYGDVFFEDAGVNPFIDTEDDRLSTFGLEVDTASYTVARRYLRDGHLPPSEAIRVEEVVNALSYGDRGPARGDFALTAEGAPTPFGEGERYHVLRFAVTARAVDRDARPPAVLTFVVDVSGSMAAENRLGLVKQALYELLAQLREDDRVGLVVYGSRGEVLLEPTTDHERIRRAVDRLQSGGSTNAEEGLVLAYDLAARFLDSERINRVILCSDGVANVGRTGPKSILARIKRDAERGIELTTVGFGMGNYNDVLMEQLADSGDGRYAYVDTLSEARRLFVEELTGTLLTLGLEAKAQVEFDPRVVSRYRLLGYENRDIADERFRDPTVDAGEIGAGHTVTALYEVKLRPNLARRDPVATLRFRYVPTGASEAVELERALQVKDLARSWDAASPALRLASLVGEYAELLKGTYWARQGSFAEVLRRTQQLTPSFAGDPRVADFASLVATASQLSPPPTAPPRQVTDGE